MIRESLRLRSILRGVMWAGAIMAFIVFLQLDAALLRVAIAALGIGTVVSFSTYRKGTGRVPFPDGILLAIFSGMLAFWIWVLSTRASGMTVDSVADLISAMLVMAFSVAGIILIVWNRRATGAHFLQEESGATPTTSDSRKAL